MWKEKITELLNWRAGTVYRIRDSYSKRRLNEISNYCSGSDTTSRALKSSQPAGFFVCPLSDSPFSYSFDRALMIVNKSYSKLSFSSWL